MNERNEADDNTHDCRDCVSLQSKLAKQQKQIEALTAGLQKGERPAFSKQTCAAGSEQQSVKLRPLQQSRSNSQSAVTFQRVAAFCFTGYGSFNSPACSCVSITLPASS